MTPNEALNEINAEQPDGLYFEGIHISPTGVVSGIVHLGNRRFAFTLSD